MVTKEMIALGNQILSTPENMAFAKFLTSALRKARMTSNLKGSRTGTPIEKHLAVVTVADIESFEKAGK